VSRDADAAVALVQTFMNAYNDIVQFMKDQDAAALAGKASLARDPLLRGFRNAFRAALQDEYNDGGTFTRLAQVGVGFDRSGKLTLDRTVLNAAISSSATDVQTLLSGAAGDGGVFGALAATVEDYTKAGGLVGLARERLTTQTKGIESRLDALEARLAVRRATLQKEYQEADRLMSQLNSQGNTLTQLGVQFNSLG
jgi:flagellar hook-associated protein 2